MPDLVGGCLDVIIFEEARYFRPTFVNPQGSFLRDLTEANRVFESFAEQLEDFRAFGGLFLADDGSNRG